MNPKEDWQSILLKEIKSKDFNHISFLNKYENIIPGPNRAAKRRKIQHKIVNYKLQGENIKEQSNVENKIVENKDVFKDSEMKINAQPKTTIRFGIISDTHICSKYTQLTYLHKFYDICKDIGITDIYHAGDIDDGEQMRPGHAYDNYKQGADEHIEEIIKNYPYREGITTHFITGNHDSSFRKSCGLDIGYQIQAKRKDMHYLCRDIATIDITDKVKMMLRHPWDGTTYALSYKPQKMIESMSNLKNKPQILCIGHYHKMEYMYYLGVHCLQTGCFQGATPFTIGKGIRTSIGGWIVEITLSDNGDIESFTPKAITFDSDILNDYKNFE